MISWYFILIIIGVLVAFLFLLYYLFSKKLEKFSQDQEQNKEIQRLDQRLDQISQSITQNLLQGLGQVSDFSQKQIQSFSQDVSRVGEYLKQVLDKQERMLSFQEIFKSPKLRGGWGEISLETLLKEYIGKDLYIKQYRFKTGEIVDFVIKLPNDLILSIDAKFPIENFQKMIEAKDEKEKIYFKKLFIEDVKKHIEAISQKYILPNEGTVDVALMFIPAETIYYEIINNIKEIDLSDYAFKRRIIATSPNTLRLHLAAINHWFRDVQVSKQTKEILKKLGQIIIDAQKLETSFKKLGKHLSDSRSSFEDSEKRLSFIIERSKKLIDLGQKNETPKLE